MAMNRTIFAPIIACFYAINIVLGSLQLVVLGICLAIRKLNNIPQKRKQVTPKEFAKRYKARDIFFTSLKICVDIMPESIAEKIGTELNNFVGWGFVQPYINENLLTNEIKEILSSCAANLKESIKKRRFDRRNIPLDSDTYCMDLFIIANSISVSLKQRHLNNNVPWVNFTEVGTLFFNMKKDAYEVVDLSYFGYMRDMRYLKNIKELRLIEDLLRTISKIHRDTEEAA